MILQKISNNLTYPRFPSFPSKTIRAWEIARYVEDAKCNGVVCFSCGNASRALRSTEIDVVDVSRLGGLSANRWWTDYEIKRVWPDRFDATSGHLPLPLMVRIAELYKRHLSALVEIGDGPYFVPTGSGETIICLSIAYPKTELYALFNCEEGTEFCKDAALIPYVTSRFKSFITEAK